jgi:nicotinate-nucleotide adenylyltransferase
VSCLNYGAPRNPQAAVLCHSVVRHSSVRPLSDAGTKHKRRSLSGMNTQSPNTCTNRIGVLGGTFNPIHRGHLHIAGEIQRIFSLSQVHFVVAMAPPHKAPEDLIPFVHRYAMVSLATAGAPSFVPSSIELEPESSPFSVDTMRKLERSLGSQGVLYFIAGGDSLAEVKSWRESEKLLTSYNFIFAVRPGIGPLNPEDVLPGRASALVRDLTRLKPVQLRGGIEENGNIKRIYILDVHAPDISATQIRKWVFSENSEKTMHDMVPEPVCEYIQKLHLYGGR